jgi:hypothetical protein
VVHGQLMPEPHHRRELLRDADSSTGTTGRIHDHHGLQRTAPQTTPHDRDPTTGPNKYPQNGGFSARGNSARAWPLVRPPGQRQPLPPVLKLGAFEVYSTGRAGDLHGLWVPETMHTALDLPLRCQPEAGMIRRWHYG